MFREPLGPIKGNSSKLAILGYSGQFSMLLVTDFGSHCDPNVCGTSGSSYGELIKSRSFGLFWPLFYPISRSFWVPMRCERVGSLGSGYGELVKTRSFGLFLRVFYATSH